MRILQSAGIRVVPMPSFGVRRIGAVARAPFTSVPLQVLLWHDARYLRMVHDLIGVRAFDVAHVQLVRMGWTVPALHGLPVVVDLVDALSASMLQRARCVSFPMSHILRVEATRLRRYEQEVLGAVHRIVLASADDVRALGSPNTAAVVPNGVDTTAFPYVEPAGQGSTVVFLGRMAYPPNVDAASWFARAIFPRVRADVPEAGFVIVGSQPPLRVRRLGRLPGVTVTGTVPNVHEYLSRADVFAAPVRIGTGMLNKVLEAMSSGVPVVACARAVSAIGAVHDEHCLIGDDERELAAHVVRLIRDKALARRLARSARALVEARYSWERAVHQLEDVYRAAIRDAPEIAG